MAAGFAQWIDALHGQAGQVLHSFTSESTEPRNSERDMLGQPRGINGPLDGLAARRDPLKENAWPEIRSSGHRTGDRAGTANLMARILT